MERDRVGEPGRCRTVGISLLDFAWEVLDQIRYKDWTLDAQEYGPGIAIQVRFDSPDSQTGRPERQAGRLWPLPFDWTVSDLVRTAFLAIMTAEEHEIRETFRYRDRAIFGPHFDVEVLAMAIGLHETDVRPQTPL